MNISSKIKEIRKQLKDGDWINPSAEIRQSEIGGKGLFALEPIKKGTFVIIWGGDYVNFEVAMKEKKKGKLIMQWDTDLFSVENRGESLGYFVNHSCDPNLYMQGVYVLATMKDIKKNEELTADYAIWEADEHYVSKWDCNCSSDKCRKKLTGKDWRLPVLQERYKNHFSPLINKRIHKNLLTAFPYQYIKLAYNGNIVLNPRIRKAKASNWQNVRN